MNVAIPSIVVLVIVEEIAEFIVLGVGRAVPMEVEVDISVYWLASFVW